MTKTSSLAAVAILCGAAGARSEPIGDVDTAMSH